MLEKQLEKKLKTEVEKLGGLCLKLVTPGFTGIPDRLVIMPAGVVYFIEVKKPGKITEARQDVVIDRLRELSHNVWVLDSEESLKLVIGWIKTSVKERIG